MLTKFEVRSDLEVSLGRRDSAFYDNSASSERLHQEDVDKIRATALYCSSARIRMESTDSGVGGMAAPATEINLTMKKVRFGWTKFIKLTSRSFLIFFLPSPF